MGVRLLVVSVDGRKVGEEIAYPFDQQRVVLGRGAGADVRIPHRTVSETHATLELEGNQCSIVDDGSTNGTRVNGERLVAGRRKVLKDGDQLIVGVYALVLKAGHVVTDRITAERTSELARRLIRESRADQARSLPPPRLVVLDGPGAGHSVDLHTAPAVLHVGRDPSCQLVLADEEVSRQHLAVTRDLDGVEAAPLEAKNGIEINGLPTERRRLKDGDEIKIGQTRLLFEEPADESIGALHSEEDEALPAAPQPTPSDPQDTGQAGPQDAEPAADREPEIPKPVAARSPGFDADVIIYGLAAIVLLMSVAGLLLLLRAG